MKVKNLGNKGKYTIMGTLGLLAVVFAVVIVAGFAWTMSQGLAMIGSDEAADTALEADEATKDLADAEKDIINCPAEKTAVGTFGAYNKLNETGSETYDMELRCVGTNGAGITSKVTISDTTAGTATFACVSPPVEYTCKGVSTDGVGGDSSRILSIIDGNGAKVVDGNLVFTPKSATFTIDFMTKQHGNLSFKAKDNKNNGAAIYDSNGNLTTLWNAAGVTYQSITNGTVYDETDGIDVTISAKSDGTDTDFSDRGFYVLLELPNNVWQAPTLSVGGVIQENIKGNSAYQTVSENVGYSEREYIYYLDQSILDGGAGVDVRMVVELISGKTATADPIMEFAPRGTFLSIEGGGKVKEGGVKDDSANTAVYAIQAVTLDITA